MWRRCSAAGLISHVAFSTLPWLAKWNVRDFACLEKGIQKGLSPTRRALQPNKRIETIATVGFCSETRAGPKK